jgi:hypothetical protein
LSSTFRTKRRRDGSEYVHPIEGTKGLPKGKEALKKNATEIRVKNEHEVKTKISSKKSEQSASPSIAPTPPSVVKPSKEK